MVVLDVNLVDIDGFEVCRRMRSEGDETPVIFLTARTHGYDVISGLRIGGDDYVTKPFQLGELSLRLAAILRRSGLRRASEVRVGPIVVRTERHEIAVDDLVVHFTPREYAVLSHLVINADRVVSKGQVAEALVGVSGVDDDRLVETYVSRIRAKLGHHAPLLVTVRGFGYRLRGEPME